MLPQIDKLYLNHDEIRSMIWGLYNKVSKIRVDEVIGIERGGLNISIPLSKMLGKPHSSIKISFYNGEKRRKKPIVNITNELNPKKHYLICDDLVDAGNTMAYFYKHIAVGIHCKSAVLFHNKENKKQFTPDFWVMPKPKQWIIFPWLD